MDDLLKLAERVEAEMLHCVAIALREAPGSQRTAFRAAAAEYAMILAALRARSQTKGS